MQIYKAHFICCCKFINYCTFHLLSLSLRYYSYIAKLLTFQCVISNRGSVNTYQIILHVRSTWAQWQLCIAYLWLALTSYVTSIILVNATLHNGNFRKLVYSRGLATHSKINAVFQFTVLLQRWAIQSNSNFRIFHP